MVARQIQGRGAGIWDEGLKASGWAEMGLLNLDKVPGEAGQGCWYLVLLPGPDRQRCVLIFQAADEAEEVFPGEKKKKKKEVEDFKRNVLLDKALQAAHRGFWAGTTLVFMAVGHARELCSCRNPTQGQSESAVRMERTEAFLGRIFKRNWSWKMLPVSWQAGAFIFHHHSPPVPTSPSQVSWNFWVRNWAGPWSCQWIEGLTRLISAQF